MIVDHQAHWLPPASLDALAARAQRSGDGWLLEITDGARLPVGPAIADLEAQLDLAASLDIDVLVLSPPPLGECQHLPAAEAAESFRV
jgi:hypothetical protein